MSEQYLFNPFSARTFFSQILTYKDDPHTERIKIIIMTVDPKHSKIQSTGIQMKQEEPTKTNYDDFKLKKNPIGLHSLYTNISAL